MFSQSLLLGETLAWLRTLSASCSHRFFTLNNESQDLHEHRVRTFQLGEVFEGFLTSCYLGQVKPDEGIYESALGIAGCNRQQAVFIDDRLLNIEPAAALGLHAIHFTGLDPLREALKEFGIDT